MRGCDRRLKKDGLAFVPRDLKVAPCAGALPLFTVTPAVASLRLDPAGADRMTTTPSAVHGLSGRSANHDVAGELAAEVQASTRPYWRKLTSLLDRFGAARLTPSTRDSIGRALDAAGLVLHPPLDHVERASLVRVSARHHPDELDPKAPVEAALAAVEGTLSASVWRPGERHEEVSLTRALVTDEVLWLDVLVDEGTSEAALHRALRHLCGDDVTPAMVSDLLTPDRVPMVKDYGRVRAASTFSVHAEESKIAEGESEPSASGGGDGGAPSVASASKAGVLAFQPVEFIASDRWLVSCWQPGQAAPDGVRKDRHRAPESHQAPVNEVKRYWCKERRTSAGDLGLLVFYELARSYEHATRLLYSWIESWELDFYSRRADTEIDSLIELRRYIAEFREKLLALYRSGMAKNRALVWLPVTKSDKADWVDERIERSLDDLRTLAEMLQTSIGLVASVTSARQSRQSQRFQENATVIASVLLVPALVGEALGADEILDPGFWAVLAVLGLMALAGLLGYIVIRVMRRRALRDGPSISGLLDTQLRRPGGG